MQVHTHQGNCPHKEDLCLLAAPLLYYAVNPTWHPVDCLRNHYRQLAPQHITVFQLPTGQLQASVIFFWGNIWGNSWPHDKTMGSSMLHGAFIMGHPCCTGHSWGIHGASMLHVLQAGVPAAVAFAHFPKEPIGRHASTTDVINEGRHPKRMYIRGRTDECREVTY